jgi:hypothetical protein
VPPLWALDLGEHRKRAALEHRKFPSQKPMSLRAMIVHGACWALLRDRSASQLPVNVALAR